MAQPNVAPATPTAIKMRLAEAVRLHNAGRAADVERVSRSILAAEPDQVDALQLLAVARANQNDPATAEALLRRAIAIRKADPRLHLNLGTVLIAAGRFAAAIEAYGTAATMAPTLVDAHVGMAAALIVTKQLGRAEAAARAALRLAPHHLQARQRLVVALTAAGRFEEAAAERRQMVTADEELGFRVDLAGQLLNWQRFVEAEVEAQAVLDQQPDHVQALVGLAYARMRGGRQAAAEEPLQLAASLAGPKSLASAVLGCLRVEQGRFVEGSELLLEATRRPDAPAHEFSTSLCNLAFRVDLTSAERLEEHRRFAQRYEPRWERATGPHRNDRSPHRPLRLGFVSPDFCAHSVSFFFVPLLEALSRQGAETFCYGNNARSDDITARIAGLCTGWRDLRALSDEEGDALIRQDRVDVLIDLAGHSADNRLSLFGRRPAPVQLTWLGYAGTTGMSVFDGRIVDRRTDPAGSDGDASEPLLRLPRCFLAYAPHAWPAIVPPPCLERGHITFGSFNNFSKINDPCLDVWAQVLRSVPGSRLLLKSSLERHPEIRERVLARLVAGGVEADRVGFLERTPDLVSHLACYGEIDVALDTFPYNGTTTTCEALWMGVPVVTLNGDSHMARVGASLLSAVRFEAGIAADAAEYVLTASQLARHPAMLEGMRTMLRAEIEASPLGDPAGLADALMATIRPIWTRWCGEAPTDPATVGPGQDRSVQD